MKTWCLILGLAAAISALPAWLPGRKPQSAALGKVGQVLGKECKPEQVARLRVASWDDEAKLAKVFEVRQDGGVWTIPSHHNYPADGSDGRVGKTAGKVLNLPRGRHVTDNAKDHKDLGVLDPAEFKPGDDGKGCGKRITVHDQSGTALVDLIIGERAKEGDGTYVREAGSTEVYTVKNLSIDISTRFADWVETDLLKLSKDDLRAVTVKDYSVDETQGVVQTRANIELVRKDASADWTSAQAPADQRLAKDAVDKLIGELDNLKLAGIRPFNTQWLQDRGFFLSPNPQLVSDPQSMIVGDGRGGKLAIVGNEGGLSVTTKDGLRYLLYFGEVALGDDEDAKEDSAKKARDARKDAAKKELEKKDADKKDEAKKDDAKPATGNNRYLAVFVQYDPKADEDARKEAEKKAAEKKDEAAKKDEPKKEDEKAPAGKAKADKAQTRFLRYFYIISNSSFETLRPGVSKLFEKLPMAGKTGKTNKQWLEENGKKPGVTTTASGLQYEIIKKGSGRQPTDTDTVETNYRGTLVDGEEFDSNKDGKPASFQVTGVVKGWTETLKLMHEGDKWRIFVPPDLGYGSAGSGEKIKADAILIFEMELVNIPTAKPVEVKPAADAAKPGAVPAKPAVADPAVPADAAKPAADKPSADAAKPTPAPVEPPAKPAEPPPAK